jgi:hypothetical protein
MPTDIVSLEVGNWGRWAFKDDIAHVELRLFIHIHLSNNRGTDFIDVLVVNIRLEVNNVTPTSHFSAVRRTQGEDSRAYAS